MARGALTGLKVLEYATMVSGPYCGKLFADLGADVIKVEPPEGDPARHFGPFPKSGPHPERSALFLYNNTSKRGITLDLDKAAGLAAFKRLLQWADVLIDNHPPQRLEKLGLGWEAIHEMNPRLIYTSITPYGRTGRRANVKGDEVTLIQAGGLGNILPARSMDIDRAPVKLGGYAVGYHGAIAAATATMGGVFGRIKTGRGQLIDVSLQEVVLMLVRPNVAGNRYNDTTWSRVPDRPPAMGRTETKDGYIIIGAAEDHHFRAFIELMGNPEWGASPAWNSNTYRARHGMEIAPMINEWAAQQTKDDIHHRGAKKGIPMGPVNSVEDLLRDGQYAFRGYFVEVEHPEVGKHKYAGWPHQMTASPPQVSRPAPMLGQHNHEVLCSVLGYTEEEFEHLSKGR